MLSVRSIERENNTRRSWRHTSVYAMPFYAYADWLMERHLPGSPMMHQPGSPMMHQPGSPMMYGVILQ